MGLLWVLGIVALLPAAAAAGAAAPPPPPAQEHWRQRFHALPATPFSQDITAPFFDPVTRRWHVGVDCSGGYAPRGGLSWCHLSSTDLLHWREHPVTLYPTSNATLDPCVPTVVDTGSISVMPHTGHAFAIYATANATSTRTVYDGNVCLAVSTDPAHEEWTRLGPIINNPTCAHCSAACPHCTAPGVPCNATPGPPGCETPIKDMIPRFGFRDPTTPYLAPCGGAAPNADADADACWFVVIGSGTTQGREAAGLLYRSQSSTDIMSPWTFVDVLIQEGAGRPYEQYQYSCPDFFQMPGANSSNASNTWVWMSLFPAFQAGDSSHADIYYVGSLANNKFVASAATPLTVDDNRKHHHFGHTIAKSAGGEGRRLLWGAVCGLPGAGIPNPPSAMPGATLTHRGCSVSLPQELSMSSGGELEFRFIPELARLRNTSFLQDGSPVGAALDGGLQLEIQAEFAAAAPSSSVIGLALFGGAVRVAYNGSSGDLFFDGNATQPIGPASLMPRYVATTLRLTPGEALRLHVYVDGSVVEVIANDRSPLQVIVVPPADADLRFAAVGQPLSHVAVHTLGATA